MPPMGTLVIRTWYEPDQVSGFRARVMYGRGHEGEANKTASANPDEVLSIVREWLAAQPGSSGG